MLSKNTAMTRESGRPDEGAEVPPRHDDYTSMGRAAQRGGENEAIPVPEKAVRHPTLVVDDHFPIRNLIRKLLEPLGYECTLAANAAEAEKCLSEQAFDLVLSDVNMPPGKTGIELIKRVVADYPNTATIMVTGADDPELAELAVSIGAYGYVIKPFKANELIINVSNALRRRQLEIDNRAHREILEKTVLVRTADLRKALTKLQLAERAIRIAHEETIIRLTRAAEFRDNETAQHIQRMSRYCELLAAALGMDAERVQLIRNASPMHDIGKIGTPDNILLKKGRLTPEEMTVMKEHAEIGYRILQGTNVPILELGAMIARTHHEKYNGTGYPMGLKGEDILLEGRLTAIADVYDALTSKRVYKPAFSVEDAVDFMRSQRGEHFDPMMLDLFLDNLDSAQAIKAEFPDD